MDKHGLNCLHRFAAQRKRKEQEEKLNLEKDRRDAIAKQMEDDRAWRRSVVWRT